MTKVKVCGLRRKEDIILANAAKPDYIGYVFARGSRRYISPEAAGELTQMLDPSIVPVGVFVNSSFDEIISIVNSGAIKMAQLHGGESDELIFRLKEHGVPVIRAFKVNESFEASAAECCPADYILLDSGSGSGKTFDWSLIGSIHREYFLAGGLDAGNVSQAIERLHPYGVDASSSMETNGFKDRDKVMAFVRAARLLVQG